MSARRFRRDLASGGGYFDTRSVSREMTDALQRLGISRTDLADVAGADQVIRGRAEFGALFRLLDGQEGGRRGELQLRTEAGDLTEAGRIYEQLRTAIDAQRERMAQEGARRFRDDPVLQRIAAGRGALGLGDRGEAVRRVQQALKDLGYGLLVTGRFDDATEAVVERFQREHGLAVDGWLGPETLGALTAVSGPPGQARTRRADYDALFEDRRLDVTIAIGHTDGQSAAATQEAMVVRLEAAGFARVTEADRSRLGLDGERFDPHAEYFVRSFRDPDSGETVDTVVRLISAHDDPVVARASFEQALAQDEVVMYFGDTAGGRGPDFDGPSSDAGDFVMNPSAPGPGVGVDRRPNGFATLQRPEYQLLMIDSAEAEALLPAIRAPGVPGRTHDRTDAILTTAGAVAAAHPDHAVRFLEGFEGRESNNVMLAAQDRIDMDARAEAGLPAREVSRYYDSGFLSNRARVSTPDRKARPSEGAPTEGDLPNHQDARLAALPARVQEELDRRVQSAPTATVAAAYRQLAGGPGFARLPSRTQLRALQALDRAPSDVAYRADLIAIVESDGFASLSPADQDRALTELSAHAHDAEVRAALRSLVTSADPAVRTDLLRVLSAPRFARVRRSERALVWEALAARADAPEGRRAIAQMASSDRSSVRDDLFTLLVDERFRALPETVQTEALLATAAHGRARKRRTVRQLVQTVGFSQLDADEQTQLLRLAGGHSERLAKPAQKALRRILGRHRRATTAEQLRTLFRSDWAPALIAPTADEFDRAALYTLSRERTIPNYEFKAGGRQDAIQYRLTIEGHTIDIFVPARGSSSAGRLHRAREIARAIARMPPYARGQLKVVNMNPDRNPADERWEEAFDMPDLRSFASVNADGTLNLYPVDRRRPVIDSAEFAAYLTHEAGHIRSQAEWGRDEHSSRWAAWRDAMASDRISVSAYAKRSIHEDFAETYLLYEAVRGTPQEAEVRRLLPARFRLIDQLVGRS